MLVTDLWVERCLYRKQFEEPQASVTNTPFRKFPIAAFKDLTICSTGFQGIDLVHMSKAVKLMGATYDEFFTPKASVLLCNAGTPGNEKLFHAQLWAIPAVKAEWLWKCIRGAESYPFGPYLVQPLRNPHQVSTSDETPISQDKSAESREKEKSLERTDVKSRRPKKTLLPPEEMDKHPAKDTFSSSKQVHVVDSEAWPSTITKSLGVDESHLQDTSTTDGNTMTAHNSLDDDSSHTLRPTSGPLHEISPNTSQPKLSTSPEKPPQRSTSVEQMPSPQKPNYTSSSSLGPAISSLLAHHQRTSTNPAPSATSSSDQTHPYRRRRRQLFGRAPSNLSSHSINLSRASSVDTMNTDGLGTPLEPTTMTNKNKPTNNAHTNNTNNHGNNNKKAEPDTNPIWSANQQEDDPDREEPPLQMTQLGYEDETVKAWREKVDIKMGVAVAVRQGKAGKQGHKGTTTPAKGGKAIRDRDVATAGAGAGLGISRRTRLASGR